VVARLAARGHAVEARHHAAPGMTDRVRAAYAAADVPAGVVEYVDDMAAEYASAHFAVVSAGAVTLAELAATGVPALVVPLARAALDHQAANARAFAQATGARWTREADWEPDALAAHVATLIESPAAWNAASTAVRGVAAPDAAAAVVRACEEMLAAPQASGRRRVAR
jgi:UDP-N-acetylglucosamine--N-acetylmuramyl-(pentapeptide) pyrophosphoryl-undecaprenol N-acetylglucosamine transferase